MNGKQRKKLVFGKMLKRKKEYSDEVEGRKRKRKTQLENAKQYINKTHESICTAAKLFGVGRESLSIYLRSGHQTIGCPPGLQGCWQLQLYLLVLDMMNMQQPLQATSQAIQKLSGSSSSPSMKTVKKYASDSELKIQKARPSDEGRTHATESIEDSIHYYGVLEICLLMIVHDQNWLFNVDKVGIQVADQEIHLVTGCEYLNKTLNQTSIHVTLALCSSPCQMESMTTPHFLYQCPEGAD